MDKQQTQGINRTDNRDEENGHKAFTYETQAVSRENDWEKKSNVKGEFEKKKI